MAGPHFICIGAPKAGTTWLHQQFVNHRSIWVPFAKELHFFNHRSRKYWYTTLASRSAHGRRVRRVLIKGIIYGKWTWTYKYLFQSRPFDKYSELFPNNGKVTGEITPAYSLLPEVEIQEIAKHYPNCKIIFILRNPVDRVWSHINMKRFKSNFKDSSEEDIFSMINERHLLPSRYMEHIRRWKKWFPKENMYLGFYEELKENPEKFLNNIYCFLGVGPVKTDQHKLGEIHKIKHPGNYSRFPMAYKLDLMTKFYSDIEELHMEYNNVYTERWLNEAKSILGK